MQNAYMQIKFQKLAEIGEWREITDSLHKCILGSFFGAFFRRSFPHYPQVFPQANIQKTLLGSRRAGFSLLISGISTVSGKLPFGLQNTA